MKPFLSFHSWPYYLKYIKHGTKINSVLNYFYLRSGKSRKSVFVKVNFIGKNNLERNLSWFNVQFIKEKDLIKYFSKKVFLRGKLQNLGFLKKKSEMLKKAYLGIKFEKFAL